MKKDFKYILKRILIGVGIVLVMSFINSCDVHAQSYMLEYLDYGTNNAYWTNNSNQYAMVWGTKYTGFANNSLTNIRPAVEICNPSDCDQYGCSCGLYGGSYLIDFYLVTDGGFNVNSCDDLSHNFQNINQTTGNWVSNQVYGSCIATSKGRLDNSNTLHVLYSFEIRKDQWNNDFVQEFRFLVNRGSGFLSGSNWFRFIMGGVYDYDQSIIDNFQNQALTNTMIEQNTQIINGQQSIINSQQQIGQQAHQDSQAINDTLNDSSIPSDSESKINNITSRITANQNSSIVQIATFFPQMLQLIINGMNTSCTGGYSLGSLYGTELRIPCINPVDYLGSTIWGTIDAILCLCYLIPLCKFLVNKYNDLTSMKNLKWGG